MSRTDRKAWRENKRANHRRNEERRWDRKCAFAFGSLWSPIVQERSFLDETVDKRSTATLQGE